VISPTDMATPRLPGRRRGGRLALVTGIIAWLILAANAIVTGMVVVLLTFAFTTLVDEPATAVALVVILLLSVALDVGWKRVRDSRVPAG
jgi:hypothetical protein